MTVLNKLLAVISNTENQIKIANVCDQAYAEGTGNPTWYAQFGAEKPEHVGINLAAQAAVVSGVSILALIRGINLEENLTAILGEIAENKVSKVERGILLRLANATWNAQQPLRMDKGALGRASNMNVFDLLPAEEVDKDFIQIEAAAKFLLQALAEV